MVLRLACEVNSLYKNTLEVDIEQVASSQLVTVISANFVALNEKYTQSHAKVIGFMGI